MSDLAVMGIGMLTVAFILALLIYVRRAKDKMRRSVLRFERIRKKLED
jgi:uncharacterized membrane protein (DUF485 family)